MRFRVREVKPRTEHFAHVFVSDFEGTTFRRIVADRPLMLYGVYPLPQWIDPNRLSVGADNYGCVIDALRDFVDGPEHDPARSVMADALRLRDVRSIIAAAHHARMPHGETEMTTAARRLRAIESPSGEPAKLAGALDRAERLLSRSTTHEIIQTSQAQIIGRRSLEALEAAAGLDSTSELDNTCAALRARLDALIEPIEQRCRDELTVLATYHRTQEGSS